MFDYPDLPYIDVPTNEHGKVKTIRVCRESIMHYGQKHMLSVLVDKMTLSDKDKIWLMISAGLMGVCVFPKTGKYMFDVDISPQANADIYAKNHKDAKQSSDDEICSCANCLKGREELQQGEILKFAYKTTSTLLGKLTEASQELNSEDFEAIKPTLDAKKKST